MTETSQTSPSKKSTLERINEENTNLRQQLTQTQNQKLQFHKLIRKQQGQAKVHQIKYSALQNQLKKQKQQNHRFVQAYQKQKKQRLLLINNQQSVLNNLNRDEIELSKLSNQNKLLKQQLEEMQKSYETQKNDRVTAIRQKQNNINKIKLLETKLEAALQQAKYSTVINKQLENQNKRLKQNVATLETKMKENQYNGPIQPQTIYKDQSQTTEKLLKQFEQKIKEKQSEMIRQMEVYQFKNSQLTLKIAELQTKLLNSNLRN